jgi:hypothetical protein
MCGVQDVGRGHPMREPIGAALGGSMATTTGATAKATEITTTSASHPVTIMTGIVTKVTLILAGLFVSLGYCASDGTVSSAPLK